MKRILLLQSVTPSVCFVLEPPQSWFLINYVAKYLGSVAHESKYLVVVSGID